MRKCKVGEDVFVINIANPVPVRKQGHVISESNILCRIVPKERIKINNGND